LNETDETKIWKNGYTHRLGYNPYGPMLINGIYNHVYLVGGAITIFKNMKVNGKDYPIYEMDNKKYLKPPTSIDG